MSRITSPLSVFTRYAANKTSPRTKKICRFTPHCMAGNLTIESCGSWFANPATKASAQYGIGSDGRIGTYCKESDRTWCTSSPVNDHRAITVEIANDGAGPQWHMSDKAVNSFIALAVDCAKFYGFKRLGYYGSLAKSVEKDDEMLITLHNWYANKACPGPYLISLMPSLVVEMNSRMAGNAPKPFVSGSEQRPVLRLNATGAYVRQLQTRLNLHGAVPALTVDGSFGPGTEFAVKEFQKKKGISVDGIVGPTCWSELDRDPAKPVAPSKPIDPVTGFNDVLGHWAYDSIRQLKAAKIVNGTTAITFDPDASITRGAFIKMLHEISGDPDPAVGNYFTDVKADAWFAPCMYWAYRKGITVGKGNGIAAPNDKMTRGEMAVMTFRYFKVQSVAISSVETYVDHAEIPIWVSDPAYGLKATGIMKGATGNYFKSNNFASRAEAATVLVRAMAWASKKK